MYRLLRDAEGQYIKQHDYKEVQDKLYSLFQSLSYNIFPKEYSLHDMLVAIGGFEVAEIPKGLMITKLDPDNLLTHIAYYVLDPYMTRYVNVDYL